MTFRLLLPALLLSGAVPSTESLPEKPALEFVESVPVETELDDPEIRNTLPVWLELIGGAERSLDIEQFYISPKPGEALDTVLGAVRAAASRGVDVRIIVDRRMYRTYPGAADGLGSVPGISVRVLDFTSAGGGIQHAKFFIVDGHAAFIGSQNFDWRALTHIRELGLVIRRRDITAAFLAVFDADWDLAGGKDRRTVAEALGRHSVPAPFRIMLTPEDTADVTPTFSPRGLIPDSSCWDERHVVSLIDGAKQELFCQFLSYSTEGRDRTPYTVMDAALRRAAARGVRVRLVVSDWEKASRSEQALKELASVPGVEVRYSVIPEWSGGYVSYARVEHCKFILVDGERFWLGTSNAEKSYFHTSRNLGVVVQSRLLGSRLRSFFLAGWGSPYGEPVLPGATYLPRRHDGE